MAGSGLELRSPRLRNPGTCSVSLLAAHPSGKRKHFGLLPSPGVGQPACQAVPGTQGRLPLGSSPSRSAHRQPAGQPVEGEMAGWVQGRWEGNGWTCSVTRVQNPGRLGARPAWLSCVGKAEFIFLHMVLLSFDLNLGTGQLLIYKSIYHTHIHTCSHTHTLPALRTDLNHSYRLPVETACCGAVLVWLGWPSGSSPMLCKLCSLATQSVVQEPATASENCLEMQRLRPCPRPAQSAPAFEQDPRARHSHTEVGEAPVHKATKAPAPASLPSLSSFFVLPRSLHGAGAWYMPAAAMIK